MIERELRGDVVILAIRHGKVNAMDLELVAALEAAFASLASDPRPVVVTGHGSVFSAGVDLLRMLREDGDYVRELIPAVVRAFRGVFTFPGPVVAALNGHAIAGGCILAAACDHRVMAGGNGRIGAPELLVGVPFPAIALEILRSVVPPQRLHEVAYRGLTYDPEAGREAGLVDEVLDAEGVLDRAVEVATAMGGIPPVSFALAKGQVRKPALDFLARHGPTIDASVESVWCAESTRQSIRSYMEGIARRKE